jgi:hypothetical protein
MEGYEIAKQLYLFALLKTCRQINSEARLLPFELNIFRISNAWNLTIWKSPIGQRIDFIRMISLFAGRIHTPHKVFTTGGIELLNSLTMSGLRIVEVTVESMAWRDYAYCKPEDEYLKTPDSENEGATLEETFVQATGKRM